MLITFIFIGLGGRKLKPGYKRMKKKKNRMPAFCKKHKGDTTAVVDLSKMTRVIQ